MLADIFLRDREGFVVGEEKSSTELGEGVYFRLEDYGSFLRRTLATLIDIGVLLFVWFLVGEIVYYLYFDLDLLSGSGEEAFEVWLNASCVLVAWGYLSICKSTSLRTLGYRMAGLKIVTLQGNRVPWYQMTVRLLLWICGPFSLFLDTLWIFTDEARQSCRDSYCGTLVVKNNAVPEGSGPIRLTFYNVMGMTLMYKRAKLPKPPTA